MIVCEFECILSNKQFYTEERQTAKEEVVVDNGLKIIMIRLQNKTLLSVAALTDC